MIRWFSTGQFPKGDLYSLVRGFNLAARRPYAMFISVANPLPVAPVSGDALWPNANV